MSTSRNFPGFVSVTGARQHNLKNVDVRIPATRWWFSLASQDRESLRLLSELCMPKRNAGTWIPWRLMRGASSSKSAFRKWTASTVCRLR